jgi:hypothetical protein
MRKSASVFAIFCNEGQRCPGYNSAQCAAMELREGTHTSFNALQSNYRSSGTIWAMTASSDRIASPIGR